MPINETELIEELEGVDKQDLTTVYNQLTSLIDNLRGIDNQDLTTLFNQLDTVEGNLEGVDSRTLTNLYNQLNSLVGGQTNLAELSHDQTTIATAGTAVALNGGTALAIDDNFGVRVTALSANAGNVYVGDSAVDSTNGYELAPKAGIVLYITDVSTVYVNGPNADDGVSWIVES